MSPDRRCAAFRWLACSRGRLPSPRLRLDVLMERYPVTSIMFLVMLTFFWVLLGATVWYIL